MNDTDFRAEVEYFVKTCDEYSDDIKVEYDEDESLGLTANIVFTYPGDNVYHILVMVTEAGDMGINSYDDEVVSLDMAGLMTVLFFEECDRHATTKRNPRGVETKESCSGCGAPDTWHPDCPECARRLEVEKREKVESEVKKT